MKQVPDHFFNQSGVLPYRFRDGILEIMLITSRGRRRWIIPKGVIEPHLSSAKSAAQEAWEEAGLTGPVSEPSVGCYERYKWGGQCQIELFLMRVTHVAEVWPEVGLRERCWLSVEAAAHRVEEEKLKQIILDLPQLVG